MQMAYHYVDIQTMTQSVYRMHHIIESEEYEINKINWIYIHITNYTNEYIKIEW